MTSSEPCRQQQSAPRWITNLSAAFLLTYGAAIPPALSKTVGTAAAVNPTSTGVQPGARGRVLRLGESVVFRERVSTSASGSTQVLFVDKTTLNVGPGSDVTIDEFVYDPATHSGRMAATMAKGVLRFVGGNTSHSGGATIRTPVATIGIRGGVATIWHDRQGTRVILGYGVVTVTTASGSTVIRRPGFAVSVSPDGLLPSPPSRVQQVEVDQAIALTTSRGRQAGGARRRPTDGIAVAAGLGRASAGVQPCVLPLQGQTLGDVYDFRCKGTPTVPPRGADEIARQAAQYRAERGLLIPVLVELPRNEPRPTEPTNPPVVTSPPVIDSPPVVAAPSTPVLPTAVPPTTPAPTPPVATPTPPVVTPTPPVVTPIPPVATPTPPVVTPTPPVTTRPPGTAPEPTPPVVVPTTPTGTGTTVPTIPPRGTQVVPISPIFVPRFIPPPPPTIR